MARAQAAGLVKRVRGVDLSRDDVKLTPAAHRPGKLPGDRLTGSFPPDQDNVAISANRPVPWRHPSPDANPKLIDRSQTKQGGER